MDGALIDNSFIHSSFFFRGETPVDCSGIAVREPAKGMYHAPSTAVLSILMVLLFERIMFYASGICDFSLLPTLPRLHE
jgi:hypothetical protein